MQGQGWKSVLDPHDLQALRQHCIKTRHHSVREISVWAHEHFQKSLTVNTVHLLSSLSQSSFKMYSGKVENGSVAKQIETWNLSLEILDKASLRLNRSGNIQFVVSAQFKSILKVWGSISAYGTGNLHIWKGSINSERYVQVLEQHMLQSFSGKAWIF